MRIPSLFVAVFVLASSVAQAQFQWVPGLDIIVRVYSVKGGPLDRLLGYDRDTGAVSVVTLGDDCHTAFVWHPSEGKGAITDILQIDARTFGLYHESGYVRLEPLPDNLFCAPLPH
jgi:hypothetical protein